ncbi:hypothetical protein SDC9_165254 [bioreactor metagenome]|uniref:Uncharacterized protein n=1 Tax=bioreactor metagenome TaxID=1076179 RepID=A0A645FWE8_9ZZZZ
MTETPAADQRSQRRNLESAGGQGPAAEQFFIKFERQRMIRRGDRNPSGIAAENAVRTRQNSRFQHQRSGADCGPAAAVETGAKNNGVIMTVHDFRSVFAFKILGNGEQCKRRHGESVPVPLRTNKFRIDQNSLIVI